jgi:hypothetical protein
MWFKGILIIWFNLSYFNWRIWFETICKEITECDEIEYLEVEEFDELVDLGIERLGVNFITDIMHGFDTSAYIF